MIKSVWWKMLKRKKKEGMMNDKGNVVMGTCTEQEKY
ncbi:Uncharacterised protein [Capnocytophaga ochracea]|uniref:Uncharacterized protein n=1 Tax=Capnocytophaga ochracea TaxID=1018 RepID=A0A2X2RX82_CAPOC|nr:Uncharacterised protein [Capnocytophaga ochracea]